jgi:hypothetical protein
MLFELAAAFAGNDLDQGDPLCDRLLDHPIQLRVNLVATVVDIVQIQHNLRHLNRSLSVAAIAA